jgi:hypothetical protein
MKREYFLSFIAFFIISFNIFSQPLSETDQSAKRVSKKEFGIFAGLGGNIQSGLLTTSCDVCNFENGRKVGFTIGVLYEHEINRSFQFGGLLGYDSRSIDATFRENELLDATSTVTNRTEKVPILFRNSATLDFNNIMFVPYIKWNPAKFLFFRLGLDLSLNVSANLKRTKELLQNTARLSNGEIVNVRFTETKENIITQEDGEYSNANKLLFGIAPMIGGNIKLSKKTTLSPIFSYFYPLNAYSKSVTNFNISSMRVILELRFLLNNISTE